MSIVFKEPPRQGNGKQLTVERQQGLAVPPLYAYKVNGLSRNEIKSFQTVKLVSLVSGVSEAGYSPVLEGIIYNVENKERDFGKERKIAEEVLRVVRAHLDSLA